MNIHNQIMNIPCDKIKLNDVKKYSTSVVMAYKEGHRDVRHAAAELSLKAEARIDELEEILKWYIEEDEINEGDPDNQYWVDGKHKAMKLLGMGIE